jgi:predicted DNA-binding transcriptional regulator AlpA
MASESEAPKRGLLLDTKQAAARTRLARQTLAVLRLKGCGPAYVKLGSRVFYFEAEVDEWISNRRRKSTSDLSVA